MSTRQTYYAASNGDSNTTSNSNQTKTTLSFTPDASVDYFLLWRASLSQDTTTVDAEANLYNGTTTLDDVNFEQKDVSSYVSVGGIAKETFGGSPSAMSYLIRYFTETGSSATHIRDARILAIKKATADEYAESNAEASTTSATPTAKVTLTFTPASTGDYLIIASCDIKNNSTSGTSNYNLDIDGTDYNVMTFVPGDGTSYRTWNAVRKVNLSNASHSIKIEYFRTVGGTAFIRNARIMAIRLDTLEANQYAEQLTRQTVTSTTYADVATLTFTPQVVDYVAIAATTFDCSNSNNSAFQRLTEGGVSDTEIEEETQASANENSFFTFYQKELTASSTTWKIQHKGENAGDTVGTDDAAIAVLQVESGVTISNSDGASAGTSTAQATSTSTAASVAAATGTNTTTGIGKSLTAAVASSDGTSTVLGVGVAAARSVASSDGTSTVQATATSLAKSPGSSAGVGEALGISTSTAASPGSSAGVGTPLGVGASLAAALASSTGLSTVNGIGNALFKAVASSDGVAVALAIGKALAAAVAASIGTSTVTGVGASIAAAVGSSVGTSTVLATSASQVAAVAASNGVADAQAVSKSNAASVGNAVGTSTVQATSDAGSASNADGAAAGTSTVTAVGAAQVAGIGESAGSSIVSGAGAYTVAPVVTDDSHRFGGMPNIPLGEKKKSKEPFDREKALQEIQQKVIDDLLPKEPEPITFPSDSAIVKKIDEAFIKPKKIKPQLPKIIPPSDDDIGDFVAIDVAARQAMDDMIAIALLM